MIDELTDENDIEIDRIRISADKKDDILEELDKLGVNEKTMFPEIERAARYITGSLSTVDSVSELIRRRSN